VTPAQLRAVLDRLGLSQSEAARLLSIDPRTMRRWVLDEQPVPAPVAILFRLLDECPAALRHFRKITGD
jgi:DNA-binding transcriptional regulator YiaG